MDGKSKLSTLIFIANRFSNSKQENREMSRPAVRIAIIGIALGLAVMLISTAVITGFKKEVRKQIIGFGSHIQITNYENYNSLEDKPITLSKGLEEKIRKNSNITAVQHIANKPGIIHTNKTFQGILLKGVDNTYDWNFFTQNLKEGTTLNDSIKNGAIISSAIAKTMQLKIGDTFYTYIVTDRLHARKFKVTGIYETTFAEYDKLYILTDLRHIQRINHWKGNQYSSLEIITKDYNRLEETKESLFALTIAQEEKEEKLYRVETIEDLTPQIFGWLDMLDMNAIVVIILMLSVSGFCVISGLLILILERTPTIGLLKSIGTTNWEIRKIFLIQATHLTGKGMIWGNIIGITLIAIQKWTHIIPLDPASYYVDHVPVEITPSTWILINIGLIIATTTIQIAPSYLVTKIAPSEAIRKE